MGLQGSTPWAAVILIAFFLLTAIMQIVSLTAINKGETMENLSNLSQNLGTITTVMILNAVGVDAVSGALPT